MYLHSLPPFTFLTPNPFTPSPSPGLCQERGKGTEDRGEDGMEDDFTSIWDRLSNYVNSFFIGKKLPNIYPGGWQ
jgi:hypothetical protein